MAKLCKEELRLLSYKLDIKIFRYGSISSAQECFVALTTEEKERLWIDLFIKRRYLAFI
jgi:hypothetical protein